MIPYTVVFLERASDEFQRSLSCIIGVLKSPIRLRSELMLIHFQAPSRGILKGTVQHRDPDAEVLASKTYKIYRFWACRLFCHPPATSTNGFEVAACAGMDAGPCVWEAAGGREGEWGG